MHDEQDGGAGQQHDAVGEGEPVAAGVQLARQVAVLGEDRAEQREAVVRGVGGEEQHKRGGRGQDDEEEVPLPKTASATCEITGFWT